MFTAGRRTRIREGLESRYDAVHARIPDSVHDALRDCGVLRWHIWRDGSTLFHQVDTREGYEAMVAAIVSLGPIDPEWDELIASLLESDPDSDRMLHPVWSMDGEGQHSPDPQGHVTP